MLGSDRSLLHRERQTHSWERSRRRRQSGWLSPIEIDEAIDVVGADACEHGRRCSQKGFFRCTLSMYMELLDWTGRQISEVKRGQIPAHLNPILTRVGLDAPGWCDLVTKFGKVFKRAAGTAEHLAEEASRRGVGGIQAPGNPLAAAGQSPFRRFIFISRLEIGSTLRGGLGKRRNSRDWRKRLVQSA